MSDLLSRFNAGEIIALVAVSGGLLCAILCGVTGIIAGCWQEVRRTDILAALKQDMLNRGMSADEIRTVVEAGLKRSSRKTRDGQSACKV